MRKCISYLLLCTSVFITGCGYGGYSGYSPRRSSSMDYWQPIQTQVSTYEPIQQPRTYEPNWQQQFDESRRNAEIDSYNRRLYKLETRDKNLSTFRRSSIGTSPLTGRRSSAGESLLK